MYPANISVHNYVTYFSHSNIKCYYRQFAIDNNDWTGAFNSAIQLNDDVLY
jgi:hypothetical protein